MKAFRPLSWWFGDSPGRFAAVSEEPGFGDWLHDNPPPGGFWVSPGQYLPRGEPVALQAQAAAAFGVPAERIVVTAWGYPPAVRVDGPLALPAARRSDERVPTVDLVVRGQPRPLRGRKQRARLRRPSPNPTSGVPANRAGWPGLWLPAASTAFRPGEDPETWAARMFYELVARGLLDVNTMQAVDMLASAGVDTATAEGAARFEAWSTGTEPDSVFDRITARQGWGLRWRAAANADRLVQIHRTHIDEIHTAFAARNRPALPDGGRR